MKLKAFGLGVLLLFGATAAPAAIITLTQDQLLDTTHWVGADDTPFFGPLPDTRGTNWQTTAIGMPNINSENGVFFTSFYNGIFAPATLTFTGNGDGLSLSGFSGEGFGFLVTNWNNQTWDFQVQATIGGTTYQSAVVPIESSGFNQGIIGETKSVIAYFGTTAPVTLTVGNSDTFKLIASNPTGNDSPHFEVNPVPEPGTMILLGSGLIGLAGWGRKKFRK